MKVVIFGATGFSGKAILAEALRQGHEVSILVRDASKIQQQQNLSIVEGNVLDADAVSAILQGQEAVIQCLGIGGTGDGKPNSFVSDATKIIVEAMQKQGVGRLIAMSNVGAGNSIAFLPWFFRKLILPYFMKWLKVIIDDKNIMETVIMNSNLDWTIVRCPNIVDKAAKNNCLVSLDGKGLRLSISLPDMAKFMIEELVKDSFIRQAPCISNQ
jgi:putative NADH-flavin reductase